MSQAILDEIVSIRRMIEIEDQHSLTLSQTTLETAKLLRTNQSVEQFHECDIRTQTMRDILNAAEMKRTAMQQLIGFLVIKYVDNGGDIDDLKLPDDNDEKNNDVD